MAGACDPTVLIGGLPAARISDKAICMASSDVIISGAMTVLIGGLPAARMGDRTAHDGVIIEGCGTVLIGDAADGSSGDQDDDASPEDGDDEDGDEDDGADDDDDSDDGDERTDKGSDPEADSAAEDGASSQGGEGDLGGDRAVAQSLDSTEAGPALQGGVEETSTAPGEIGGDQAVAGSLNDDAPSSMTLYGNAEETGIPDGELGGDRAVAGSLENDTSSQASLYGEVLQKNSPASSTALYGGVQDTGEPPADSSVRLYGSAEESSSSASSTTLYGEVQDKGSPPADSSVTLYGQVEEDGPPASSTTLYGWAEKSDPPPSSILLKGEAAQNAGAPFARETVFGHILTPAQGHSQSVSGRVLQPSSTDDGPGGDPGAAGPSDQLTRTTTLTGRILGTQPQAPTIMMPDGMLIELRPALTQKDLDDQRYSGTVQGFGNGMKNYGHDDAIDYLKYNIKDKEGWKGDKIADYASGVAGVFHEGAADGLGKLSAGLGVYQDMSGAQEKLQKWVDFQNDYDQKVREGKLQYSPIVQNYTNGQMLAITIHAYKGFLGGIP